MSKKITVKRTQKATLFPSQFASSQYRVEVETPEGLEHVVLDELQDRVEKRQIKHLSSHRGALRFDYSGDLPWLLSLRTAIAVYLLLPYTIPRPRALLGHEHFYRLLAVIRTARAVTEPAAYRTLFLSAAGSDSSVMMRLKQELATATGLHIGDQEGDLHLRIRRVEPSWEVLIRLSSRPSVTRAWRVCNFEGALNAAVAHAMVKLSTPNPTDVFLNLTCGSGTLMVERLSHSLARRVIGCDWDPFALACAKANIQAAGYTTETDLILADASHLPLPDNFADALCADLPFGQLVGTHAQNQELYPKILNEAARVARKGSLFIVITHEIRLLDHLSSESRVWRTENTVMVTLRGLHPRIYVLRKFQ